MLIFRSEEHLDEWLARGHPAGERLTLQKQWELARRWFAGRHLAEWRPRSKREAGAVFASLGLTSGFWRF